MSAQSWSALGLALALAAFGARAFAQGGEAQTRPGQTERPGAQTGQAERRGRRAARAERHAAEREKRADRAHPQAGASEPTGQAEPAGAGPTAEAGGADEQAGAHEPAGADERAGPVGAASASAAQKLERALPKELAPRVKTALAPSSLAVGGVATLTIEVDAPSSVELSLPEQPFGTLELADRRLRSETQGDRTRTTFELDLLALEPGKLEVPALSLRFVGPNGELGELATEPRPLNVSSLIANEPNAAPKPATKPVTVMRDDYTLLWIALGLLAVAAIAGATLAISRWLRNRPQPAPPPVPPRPAWEVAIEKLDRLARQKEQLFAEQRGEEFVDGVSDAVREYLGRRYGFDGLERTTSELLETLQELRPHRLSLAGVSLLLEQCDLVKFARVTPDLAQGEDLWNGALGLIRATTPAAAEALPPDAPPLEVRS